jgi:recombinational DNA repair ATPase RecF
MALHEDLYAWFADQPAWQQDLAHRLTSRTALSGDPYDEALRAVKGAFHALEKGDSAPALQPLALEDLSAGAATGAPRLLSFGRLRGVGAASSDYELRFKPEGLTVVYGQNGAGKTTYVRGLKRVCRTVDCDSMVQGNVFEDAHESPSAKVEISLSGQTRTQQLDLVDPADVGLQAISVFDSQCAELYVDTENAVAFVPAALRLLARLAATQEQMRLDLDREADALERNAPSLIDFPEQTEVRRALNMAGAASRTDLRKLATLSAEERERMGELRAALVAQDSATARANALAASQDAQQGEALGKQLRQLGGRIASPAREQLRNVAEESVTAEHAVELARQEFDDLPVTGVGSAPWRQLWEAARSFVLASGAAFPPPNGTACPLCLQKLSEEAAARMTHFEEHVRSSVQQDARQKRETLDAALETLSPHHVEACRTPFLAGLQERAPDLHGAVDRYLEEAATKMETLRSEPTTAQLLPLPAEAVTEVESWSRERSDHATMLLAAEDPERERTLRAELAELDARVRLESRLPELEEWLERLRLAASLRAAHSALSTNRITRQQRVFSERAVTGALRTSLKEELSNLSCEHLPVDLQPKTRVGETQIALRLAGAHGTPKVSDIASEGEQRALSLSFFLAEVAMSESDGGIVVDDPVSSLDDERREYIAKRLVTEAHKRQVVVFTHDLPFMLDLIDRAEAAGLEPLVQGIWRMGTDVGRVDDHPPFKAMKLKQRRGVLSDKVAQWDKQDDPRDFDEAWRRVCNFYADLRITWERAVEERLFKGVVTRFQREVKTLALDDVEVTPEMVALIKEGMTRCSMFVHDEPPGAGTRLPDRARLAQDIDKLVQFEQLTK